MFSSGVMQTHFENYTQPNSFSAGSSMEKITEVELVIAHSKSMEMTQS